MLSLKKHIAALNNGFNYYENNPYLNDDFDEIFKGKKYKGIIVYPEAVNWEPLQRPQHILQELSKMGYLCLFCVHDLQSDFEIRKVSDNFYIVNHQEKLLHYLKDLEVIFYITYFLQYQFAQRVQKRIIWFDLLDRLDFFDNYNVYSSFLWKKIVKNADFVSYSASNLKEFINYRNDSFLLPNAARESDFKGAKKIPEEIEKIKNLGRKIIGYYGAIEEWLDYDIIEKLSEKFEIVMIGTPNFVPENVRENKSIHFLGHKKYEDLKDYSFSFDFSIIPFIVNDLTNSVSPVKFFEYLAIKKPIISSAISEMIKYDSKYIKIYKEVDEIIDFMSETDFISTELEEQFNEILSENSWTKRAEIINCKIEEVIK